MKVFKTLYEKELEKEAGQIRTQSLSGDESFELLMNLSDDMHELAYKEKISEKVEEEDLSLIAFNS